MESASYMENNIDTRNEDIQLSTDNIVKENTEEEYTPKLFSETHNQADTEYDDSKKIENVEAQQLFDQDNSEDEDFEIPAFLRRQKF